MICAVVLPLAAILSTVTYYIPNYSLYFFLSNDINYVGITYVFMEL